MSYDRFIISTPLSATTSTRLNRCRSRCAAGYLPYLAAALAGLAVVLGALGFRVLPPPDGPMRWDDALYHSLALFVMEYDVVALDGLPLSLNIARFLAPAITGYAVVQAAVVLLSEFQAAFPHFTKCGNPAGRSSIPCQAGLPSIAPRDCDMAGEMRWASLRRCQL